MTTFDQIVFAEQPKSDFDATPSAELYTELMHVKRFMDNVTAFGDI